MNIDDSKVKYTSSASVKSARGLEPIKVLSQVVRHSDLTAASTSEAIDFTVDLPAGSILMGFGRKLLSEFSGGTVSACVVDVGDGTNVDRFVDAEDVFTGAGTGYVREDPTAPGDAVDAYPLAISGAVTFTVTVTATGDNVVNLDAGAVELFAYYIAPVDPEA